MNTPPSSTLAVRIAALLVLTLCLSATLFAWFLSQAETRQKVQARFDQSAALIKARIEQRMAAYQSLLNGARGLFAASQNVERDEWGAYIESLKIQSSYPGIQGIGYAEYFHSRELEAHEARIRAEGFLNYHVRPSGPRHDSQYTSITYLEPFDWRNQRAFGFDMLSEPTRRRAMELARDTGLPSITSRVKLVQETNEAPQAGELLYIPVYKNQTSQENMEDRRQTLQGYVYAAFRMTDLMEGIFQASRTKVDIDFALYSGTELNPAERLYETAPFNNTHAPRHVDLLPIQIANGQWLVHAYSNAAFEAITQRNEPMLILVSGMVGSLLLFGIIWSLGNSRERAVRLAEKMTAQLREQLALIEAAHDAIIVRTPQNVITYWNRGAATTYGWSKETALGHNVTELLNTQYQTPPQDIEHALSENNFWQGELRQTRADGEIRHIESRWVLVRDAQNQVNAILQIDRDITERIAADRVKSEFISVVSHELRTPLTAIIGSLGLTHQGLAGQLSQDAQSLIGLALENSQRLLALINDILDFEKLSSDKFQMRCEPHALKDILEHAVTINQPYGEKYNVRFELHPPSADLYVNVDRDRLTQVFTNLLSNAAKFSPASSAVNITAQQHTPNTVRIDIQDHGPGIPQAFQTRLFQRFAQADSSDRRAKGGTGLGLAICKSIIEQLSGGISFTSRTGAGTTFHVELPLHAPPPKPTSSPKTDI